MSSSPYFVSLPLDIRDRTLYRMSGDFCELGPCNSFDWSSDVLLMVSYDFGSIILFLDGRMEFAGDESLLKKEFFESAEKGKAPYNVLVQRCWNRLIDGLQHARDNHKWSLIQSIQFPPGD